MYRATALAADDAAYLAEVAQGQSLHWRARAIRPKEQTGKATSMPLDLPGRLQGSHASRGWDEARSRLLQPAVLIQL
ncbi:hypothetical protein GCM10010449_50100 [Streptomyces rectiviolaceus]|uniref:Uncharacterized protein n=1 Tax=Streptomyces rectiviolaceus TaxID=332591 RepID=A0ABP6MTJ4_9ACTN